MLIAASLRHFVVHISSASVCSSFLLDMAAMAAAATSRCMPLPDTCMWKPSNTIWKMNNGHHLSHAATHLDGNLWQVVGVTQGGGDVEAEVVAVLHSAVPQTDAQGAPLHSQQQAMSADGEQLVHCSVCPPFSYEATRSQRPAT